MKNFKELLESGEVTRFHTVPRMKPQTNAEHCWRVMVLLTKFFPELDKECLEYALTHDAAEIYTGDIPADFKINHPELKKYLTEVESIYEDKLDISYKLSTYQLERIKLCDMLEGISYCADRIECGEVAAKKPFNKWKQWLMKYFADRPEMMGHPAREFYLEQIKRVNVL